MTAQYSSFGGLNVETALLHNMMRYYDIKNPHTNQPFSQAMIFGIGGGIGYGYFVFETGGRIVLVLGHRHLWQDSLAFVKATADRFGLTPTIVFEGGNKKAAQQALDAVIAAQRPAMTWVDMASLPYRLLPTTLVKYLVHVVTVVGKDGDYYQLDDRAAVPIPLDPSILAEARAVMPYLKNRLMTFEQPPAAFSLEEAVRTGIQTCYTSALNPPIKNFGIESLIKWADLLVHPKDKRGWSQIYPTGPALFEACKQVFRAIETDAPGGGALRPLYADFLDEAADILNQSALQSVAAKCRDAGQQWTALAEAALPDNVPAFAESKALTRQRWQLYDQGLAAMPAMNEVSQRLSAIGAELDEEFPLSSAEMADLRAHMRQHLLDIYAAEKALLEELQTVIPK